METQLQKLTTGFKVLKTWKEGKWGVKKVLVKELSSGKTFEMWQSSFKRGNKPIGSDAYKTWLANKKVSKQNYDFVLTDEHKKKIETTFKENLHNFNNLVWVKEQYTKYF